MSHRTPVLRYRSQSMPQHVLIAGISTRAAAESAARAGFAVTAIDAYADLDQHASVRSLSLRRDLGAPVSAHAAARAARSIACDAVAYGSSFENHPRAVGLLAAGRALWGNSPEVLRRVRDPRPARRGALAGGDWRCRRRPCRTGRSEDRPLTTRRVAHDSMWARLQGVLSVRDVSHVRHESTAAGS